MTNFNSNRCVIALDVRARSFGFVVIDEHGKLLDWGAKSFRSGVNAVKIPARAKAAALYEYFSPKLIVMKGWAHGVGKRRSKMQTILQHEASNQRIPVRSVSNSEFRAVFLENARNKHTVGSLVANRFPELARNLPTKRKIWEAEKYYTSVFDAAAAGLVFLDRATKRRQH